MRAHKLTAALAAVPVLLASAIGAAHADDISNDLDQSIDAVAEVMPLNVGGAAGTTNLYVKTANGDGKNGCNLTGSSELRLSVSSSNTGIATVSPSSVTFASCGDVETLTVTPVAQGSATISVAQTSNDTGGSFNLAPATFRVDVVAPSNTAPQISISGVAPDGAYPKGAVPTAMCNVTDTEDGSSSFPADLSAVSGPYAADGIGQQTATCSYEDEGDITASASATYSIVDPSAPEISYTLSPATPDGNGGWYRSAPTLTWIVTENESPSSLQTTGCVDQAVTADQVETTYTCSASSAGGNAAEKSVTIKRDKTAPTDITFLGGPTGDFYYGSDPGTPTCEASDDVSGLDTCVVTGGGSAVGTHSYVATATDMAGNVATKTLTYEVKPWTTSGFYAPVDLKGVLNTVKGGSTVPLKFEVFADAELTETTVVKSFTQTKVACDGSSTEDAIEVTSTGGTSLRYDATAGQFIQNWQTPKAPGACYVATVTFKDGSYIRANFKLK